MAFKQKLALVALALHCNRLLPHLKAAAFWFYIIMRLHTTLDFRVVNFFVFDQMLYVRFLLESGVTQLELLKPKLAVDCCFLVVHYYELT